MVILYADKVLLGETTKLSFYIEYITVHIFIRWCVIISYIAQTHFVNVSSIGTIVLFLCTVIPTCLGLQHSQKVTMISNCGVNIPVENSVQPPNLISVINR